MATTRVLSRGSVRATEPLLATLFLLACTSLVSACGGGQSQPPPVQTQSAADEILRVGEVWTASLPEKGILSPPSAISMFHIKRTSTLELSPTSAKETLLIEEDLQLRAGGTVKCATTFQHPLRFRYGRRKGEAALELVRPPLNANRACSGTHPEGAISEASRRGLFVLRSDNLVAVEPALEKRIYIPGQI